MKTLVIDSTQLTEIGGVFLLFDSDTGEILAEQFCSGSAFAANDLYWGRPDRVKEGKERWGEVEVKLLSETDISHRKLLLRNHLFYNRR